MSSLAISNYQLGDLLGRGASGSVYRALNFLNGETVAIKSISLLTLAPSSLPDIMSEIDLLKNLNHPNIVKYKGFARDKESLHIVLEYCENGSLQTILKKFGKFPESLVAVCISQVLEGLVYLHEQGVIHRDIKGANILTNKDGSVKLADFGVSSRAATPVLTDGGSIGRNGAKGKAGEDDGGKDHEVVGSPYWMAPEVIEQSGATTASDIWSVGCVVVELLEGRPPYGDLAPMQALWRIVQDESMRIPESASAVVQDFLLSCFQKDPNLRVSAKKLLRHQWMQTARKNMVVPSPTSSPPAPPARTLSGNLAPEPTISSAAMNLRNGRRLGSGTETIKPKKPITVYDEAVLRVQEWNEALNASSKPTGTIRRSAGNPANRNSSNNHHHKKGSEGGQALMGIFAIPPLPTRSSADSISAEPPSSAHPSPHHGVMQKNLHISDVLSRAKERSLDEENWDDDFAVDVSLSKLPHRKEESNGDDVSQQTLRPGRSPSTVIRPLPGSSGVGGRAVSASEVEDYSDIAFEEDAGGLEAKLASLKLKNKSQRGILHPNDLRKLKTASPLPTPIRSLSTPSKPTLDSVVASPLRRVSPSPSTLSIPNSAPLPRGPSRSPTGSRQNSLRSKGDLVESQSQVELTKYTENDDEDYSDILDKHTAIGVRSGETLQLTKRSNKSWNGADEDDINDPFAEIDDDFDGEDLEANVLREKRATLCATVTKLIEKLSPNSASSTLRDTSDELLNLFENTSHEIGLEAHFVSSHGMLAVLEVLESRLSREVAMRLLRIVNTIVGVDVDMLESFCLVGGIPVIIPYTSKKHSLDTRLEASTFIQQLTRSALTLQMFISCRGLRILVELLDEDYSVNKTLILSSLEGIGSVFDLQSPTPRNDFCRMFVREGILDPLSTALLAILRDGEITEEEPSARAVNVLLLFCQVAQADARVRDAFATRSIIIRLLKACEVLPRKLLVTAIKAIKHLSTSPQMIEILQNSNAMEVLVSMLGKCIKGAHSNEICSHIFQTIYSMTRLSKSRQEEAASSGIIPLLKRVIQGKSPLKQFALPILCDLANAGKVSRRLLWQNDGMQLYLALLEDPYWRVSALDSILAWMQDETARVEDVLLEKNASDSVIQCFVQSTGVSFEGILDPLLKILRLSLSVTTAVSQPVLFRHLASALSRPLKAVTKLNLLRLTRILYENHPNSDSLGRFGVREVVERLSRQDEAVLVRELAKEILPTLGAIVSIRPERQRDSSASATISKSSTAQGKEPNRADTSQTYRASTPSAEAGGGYGARSRTMAPPPVPSPSLSSVEVKRYSSSARRTIPALSTSSSISSIASPIPLSKRWSAQVHPPLPSPSVPSDRIPLAPAAAAAAGPLPSLATEPTLGLGRPTFTAEVKPERPSHKRKISRNQLRDVHWQTDENGQLRSVRTPSK